MDSLRWAASLTLALGGLACGSGPGGAGDDAGGEGASEGGAGGGGAGHEGGGGGSGITDPCTPFASGVESTAFGAGQGVGQDDLTRLFGPPLGGGALQGSLDVVSLGHGGEVVVSFGDLVIVDGEGADFIVFENAFYVGGDEGHVFAELGTIEVSADGEIWQSFPCDAVDPPYGSCAGWHPVFANSADNDIDPLDPAEAGGDAFDLADVGLSEARFVRVVDRPDLDDPLSGVFDLDAIGVVHGECRP
jgi:hypothetical protein